MTTPAAIDEALAKRITGLDEEGLEQVAQGYPLVLCRGGLRKSGHLSLEGDRCYIIDGPLEVSGTLTQHAPMVVTGRVRARNFVTRAWSVIQGSLEVQNLLFGNSSGDDVLDARGVKARVIIDDGHTFDTTGLKGLTIVSVSHGGSPGNPDFEDDELDQVFVDGVLKRVDGRAILDEWKVIRWASQGREFIRKDPQNKRQKAEAAPVANEKLVLTGKRLTSVPAKALSSKTLRVLDLSENDIEEVPSALARVRTLEVLILQGNPIRSLPSALAGLTRLRELDLSNTPLHALPSWISRLPSLEVLRCGRSEIVSLPAALARCPLRELDLSQYGERTFTSLPAVVSRIPTLEKLVLSGNDFTTLPDSLARLGRLRELDLSNSGLQHLPRVLSRLPSLRVLDISGDTDTVDDRKMPASVAVAACGLSRLEELRIAHYERNERRSRGLTALPPSIGRMSGLKRLSLAVNGDLRGLPPALLRLSGLEELNLWFCKKLTRLPGIERLTRLKRLTLANSGVGAAEIQRIRRALPKCRIITRDTN